MFNNAWIARLLLGKKADINFRGTFGQTALHGAVSKGSEEIVRLLLNEGADVNVADMWGRTPLDEALSGGNDKIAQLIQSQNKGDR